MLLQVAESEDPFPLLPRLGTFLVSGAKRVDPLDHQSPLPRARLRYQVYKHVAMHATAYSSGSISMKRLLDVISLPMLKLARAVNESEAARAGSTPSAASVRLLELRHCLLAAWVEAFEAALSGRCNLEDMSWSPLMVDAKRAELVKELMKINMPRVSLDFCSPLPRL